MKTVLLQDQFGIDRLSVVERPDPKPGPGQALVRVRACSLNYRDYLVAVGRYNPKMPLPRVPLSDGAGEVVETGPGVTRVKTGDRVAGIFFQTWLAGEMREAHGKSALGGAIDGMLSELVALGEDGLVHIPAHLSYEEAATLPCAAVTVWNALIAQGALKAGDTVLVQGTGGVSIFALQLAKASGARVIATSGSAEKLKRALALGASDGVNYRENPDWDKAARALTGGAGVDHVVEVGGAGTLGKSLNAVRLGGRVSVIGVLTGLQGEITTAQILHKMICLQGIYVGSRSMFEDMNRAIALHKMRPVVDRVFAMSEIREALRHMESAAHFGKIAIAIP